ncbi:HD-GYP domain-containing protein [Nitriliruptoraceae bacterium ZYF776]|nr:HD-GYP domain-containing protein [Profundirhabdus halotolerans]
MADHTSPEAGSPMYASSLDRLRPGAVLGRTVYDEAGRPLLVAGTTLTPRYLDALRRRGLYAVHVRDGVADDVVPDDLVSDRVRSTLTTHLSTTFGRVEHIAAERGDDDRGVEGAIDHLGEQPLELGDRVVATIEALYADVEVLITELLENDAIAGLESLKTHNEYTFQHSVDVAVVGVLLGRHLGLPVDRLRELAFGCLLHDIGKTYIDRLILDKPGPLTPAEFAAIREHPRMGFELVRRMPVRSLLPAHVAYQHHEKQGGGGYPRGLVGDNTVASRCVEERVGAGRMLLIAEIGAVADVYSALTSDRPYRPALPPDQVLDKLSGMAGSHLNREIVRALRRFVPSYPVGRWVEVTRGPHVGWRGVVTAVHRGEVDRPTIRLVLDGRGEELADPPEVDTRRAPGIGLACLAPNEVPTDRLVAAG